MILSTEQLSSCLPEEFRCGSGLCIPIAWQCDGEKDCPEHDGLDEWDHLCSELFIVYRGIVAQNINYL